MAKLLEHGQKVKYTVGGTEHTGIIHGVKTHENEKGQISRVAYLIDTGNDFSVGIGWEKTGKTIEIIDNKTKEKILSPVYKEVKVRQPEQIEVDQTQVKLA